ncbi:MAG: carboxymuconolactone decarboxylase family protein [Nevskiales bacterium]
MATRIPTLDPPYTAEVTEHFAKLMPPGMEPLKLFRTVAHNPRVLGRMRRGGLLDKGSITPREREIMILRTCARCGAEYEWGVHVAFFGRQAGFSEAQMHATVLGAADDPAWSADEQLLIRLADELHDSAQVSDALWSQLATRWQAGQLIELMMLAGLYHAVSYVINGTGVELEANAPRFPGV